ncbi:MAG: hypothetical protein ACXWKN_13860 [Phenylobacterium sp.]
MISRHTRQVLTLSGVLLIGVAGISAEGAWLHMRDLVQTYGVICGSGSGALAHCPACFVSLAALAAGVSALVLAHAARFAVRPQGVPPTQSA